MPGSTAAGSTPDFIQEKIHPLPFNLPSTMNETKNILPLDGEVFFYPGFFEKAEADQLMQSLKTTIKWKQEPIKIMGKEIMQPRLTALYGDTDQSYRYSGLTMIPAVFTPELLLIKTKVETVCGHSFTTALLNYYRNGQDSMGWHRDNEKSLGLNPVIASISFGVTRNFKLKHAIDAKQQVVVPLTHGSVLIMAGSTQHKWYHSIPKQLKLEGERINITFRKIVS